MRLAHRLYCHGSLLFACAGADDQRAEGRVNWADAKEEKEQMQHPLKRNIDQQTPPSNIPQSRTLDACTNPILHTTRTIEQDCAANTTITTILLWQLSSPISRFIYQDDCSCTLPICFPRHPSKPTCRFKETVGRCSILLLSYLYHFSPPPPSFLVPFSIPLSPLVAALLGRQSVY